MLTERDAKSIAVAHIDQMSERGLVFALIEEYTLEEDFGWVFFYDSKAFLDRHDDADRIAGNAPFIVERKGGAIVGMGTAEPVENYIANYRKFGTPFPMQE